MGVARDRLVIAVNQRLSALFSRCRSWSTVVRAIQPSSEQFRRCRRYSAVVGVV